MDACAKVSAFLLNACGCRNLASVFRKDRPMDVCLWFPTCLRFVVVVLQSVCLSASTLCLTTSTSCLYFFSSHTQATGLHHPKDSWHQDILAPLQKPCLLQFAWNEIRLFYWIEMERRHKGQTWRLRSDSWATWARVAFGQILPNTISATDQCCRTRESTQDINHMEVIPSQLV